MSTQPSDAPLLERLAKIDTTSLADAGGGRLRILPAALRPVRPGLRMVGRALTIDAHDDLMPMLAGLHQAGPGDVLVVAGQRPARRRRGAVRDRGAAPRGDRDRDRRPLPGQSYARPLDLPVYARGVAPTARPARAVPVIQVPLQIGGVEVRPGDLLLGDDDGIVVASADELADVLEAAETIQRREEALQTAIAAGASLFDHLNYDEHLAALEAGEDSRLAFSLFSHPSRSRSCLRRPSSRTEERPPLIDPPIGTRALLRCSKSRDRRAVDRPVRPADGAGSSRRPSASCSGSAPTRRSSPSAAATPTRPCSRSTSCTRCTPGCSPPSARSPCSTPPPTACRTSAPRSPSG